MVVNVVAVRIIALEMVFIHCWRCLRGNYSIWICPNPFHLKILKFGVQTRKIFADSESVDENELRRSDDVSDIQNQGKISI